MYSWKHLNKIIEINSTYIEMELRKKFITFIESYDRMGGKIEGVSINLGIERKGDVEEFQEEKGVTVNFSSQEEFIGEIPLVWVLIQDEPVMFLPIESDGILSAITLALTRYGMDIIRLGTIFDDLKKKIRVYYEREWIEFEGKFDEIEERVLKSFRYPQVKLQILKKIKEMFLDEKPSVDSMLITIPEHKEYSVIQVAP